jgi:hypothetical protein
MRAMHLRQVSFTFLGIACMKKKKEKAACLLKKERWMSAYSPERGESLANRIRRFAFERYVVPARATPDTPIRIRSGDLHRAMGLNARMPAVCSALDSMIFQREFALQLIRRTGPHQGANVEFTFRTTGTVNPNPTEVPTQVSAENHEGTSPLRSSTAKQRFTLRGEMFEKERNDFIKAMINKEPGRIQKYSTMINGNRYPIRQVIASATGLPPIAITSQEAYRVLEKFKFIIDIHQ